MKKRRHEDPEGAALNAVWRGMFHAVRGFRVERAAVLAGGLLVAVGLGLALSCLPDLETAPPTAINDSGSPAADSAPPAPFCGDGVIDYDVPNVLSDAGDGGSGEACDPGDGGVRGCTVRCAIECAAGFIDKATNHCYLSAGTAVSEKAASDACASRDAHVVTFGSEVERGRVQAGLAITGIYWLGLGYDPTAGAYMPAVPSEPGWKLSCPGCFADAPEAGVFPKLRADAGGQCLGDESDAGAWFQLPCFTPAVGAITAICEREPLGVSSFACDGGNCIRIHATLGTKRYLLSASSLIASDAANACQGGHLAVFTSRVEREALMKEVARILGNPPIDDSVWIGLARTNGGAWTWDDGNAFEAYPDPWGDKEPKATLGTARAYASLMAGVDIELARADDKSQTVKHPYLCEYAVTP